MAPLRRPLVLFVLPAMVGFSLFIWPTHADSNVADSRVAERSSTAAGEGVGTLLHPILFVTQMPIAADFATIGSVFANHKATLQSAGRGGDLWIRYPDGSLRNLTAEAGFGDGDGFQGANSIAVRDPAVDWTGTKAVFSMVIGAPTQQFQVNQYRWQLYEITGLEQGGTASISAVPNQPSEYNNIQPAYGTGDRIIFASDRPRGGEAHLYPQRDEYESTPTVSGLWSLDPASTDPNDLILLDHAPSGAFTPIVDSSGRVVFTRWDHLQRDQQADYDALNGNTYGTFNYADEAAGATRIDSRVEVFPEPRGERIDLLAGTNLEGHRFNHFFPWFVSQDGAGAEVLLHLGRHELHSYFNRSMNDDPNLIEFIAGVSGRHNPNSIENFLHPEEDPLNQGTFVGIEAPEFQTHSAGQVVSMSVPVGTNPDQVSIAYLTHPATRTVVAEGATVPPEHTGHYREALPLSDGSLVVVHTYEARAAGNEGSRANPAPRYDFRLRTLDQGTGASNGYLVAGIALTGGLSKTLSYFDPDVLVSYSGDLWELSPVEVRSRPIPSIAAPPIPAAELQVFVDEGVNPEVLRADLAARGLALMSVRDVTSRDRADRQQPFNLAVAGGGRSTVGMPGTIYPVSDLQLFQGDLIRGYGGVASPSSGRRVLAQVMHEPEATALNGPPTSGLAGAVTVASDGSAAAFVPARRAMSWHLTEPDGTPIVRERYWLTFQPGEIRTCDGCHGVNTVNQVGAAASEQSPEALRLLLRRWQSATNEVFSDGFESGSVAAWSSSTGAAEHTASSDQSVSN